MKPRYVVLICGLLIAGTGEGAFKCVDSEGNTTFSQQGCPTNESSSEINVEEGLNSRPASDHEGNRACELAGLYAEDAARRMREGADYSTEVARYGGTYGAKASMVALVNYVHSFAKGDAAPGRIASLAQAKCRSGGLGPVAFDDLPVSEYYVYDSNRNEWVSKRGAGAAPVAAPVAAPAPQEERTVVSAPSGEADQKKRCEEAMAGLEGVLKQMGESAGDPSKLKERLKAGCQ